MGAPFRMSVCLVPGGTKIYSGVRLHQNTCGSSDVGGVGHNGFCVGEAGVWRRRADERRAIRRAALLEAALDLFAEDGARGVSKRAICARARLNDRFSYEHFTDADAVFEAIVQDRTARGLEAVNVASQKAAPDIRAQVQETAVAALDFLTSDPRLVQLLLRSHTSEVLQQARRESARGSLARWRR